MSLVNASRSELTKQFTTAIWWILGLVLLVYVGSTAGGLAATFGALATGALGGAVAGQAIGGNTGATVAGGVIGAVAGAATTPKKPHE